MKNKSYLVVFAVTLFAVIGSIKYSDCEITPPAGIKSDNPKAQIFTYSFMSKIVHELPFAAHWNTGQLSGGFSPTYQLELLKQGHFIMPWFQMPDPFKTNLDFSYYETLIKYAATQHLPICFSGTQWERYLSELPEYYRLDEGLNPNVIDASGNVLQKVSPFSVTSTWKEMGGKWTSTSLLKQIQQIYPDPPVIVFLSNNEHSKLVWTDVETDKRFNQLYGSNNDNIFKRKVVGDGWIKLYRALQQGMRDSLTASSWKSNSVFVGYDAFGPSFLGRWGGWLEYSLYITDRSSPWPAAWDGASVSYYVNNWNSSTDFTVLSPQIESMNWIPMLDEAYNYVNRNFWFEMSTWDGYQPLLDNDKRKYYESIGQSYTPERYEGFVQFGMWLLRPRVVREFRLYNDTVINSGQYFMKVVNSVDKVHSNPVLNKFWKYGVLIPNRTYKHPYQSMIPEKMVSSDRWFLLDTNLDPLRPWTFSTEIPVFSIALGYGTFPEREWLVYAYSPLVDRENVSIKLPEFGLISVSTSVNGCFYHVKEKGRLITKVTS